MWEILTRGNFSAQVALFIVEVLQREVQTINLCARYTCLCLCLADNMCKSSILRAQEGKMRVKLALSCRQAQDPLLLILWRIWRVGGEEGVE